VQASSGNPDVILIGDFNSYAQEDPIDDLTSHGYVDQIARFNSFGYSYVFDGAAGRLDHAITTPSLSTKVTRAIEWHINADEPSVIDYNTEFKQPACGTCNVDYYSASPYRASDHDPVIVGLNLSKAINGTAGRDTIVGTAGDDVINGGEGSDTITTGAGRDVLVYSSLRDGLDTVTDFTPGADRIDLSALLASLGIAPTQAISGGYVRLVDSSAGVQVQIDTDGSAGPAVPKALTVLRGVTASQLQAARDLGL
jgi:Ca2+-binding RTX toxin-like protein